MRDGGWGMGDGGRGGRGTGDEDGDWGKRDGWQTEC